MRTFTDNHGRSWQAALLDASYGNAVLVFSPLQGAGVRQLSMDAENLLDAETQLTALNEQGLRGLLDQAEPWTPAGGP